MATILTKQLVVLPCDLVSKTDLHLHTDYSYSAIVTNLSLFGQVKIAESG